MIRQDDVARPNSTRVDSLRGGTPPSFAGDGSDRAGSGRRATRTAKSPPTASVRTPPRAPGRSLESRRTTTGGELCTARTESCCHDDHRWHLTTKMGRNKGRPVRRASDMFRTRDRACPETTTTARTADERRGFFQGWRCLRPVTPCRLLYAFCPRDVPSKPRDSPPQTALGTPAPASTRAFLPTRAGYD